MNTCDVLIDSARRNISQYPNSNNFVVVMKSPIRRIVSAEVIMSTFSKETNDIYTILDIQELKSDKLRAVYDSSQDSSIGVTVFPDGTSSNYYIASSSPGESISRSFGVIPLADTPLNSNLVFTPSRYYTLRTDFVNQIDMDRFTVTWKDQNGLPIPTSSNNSILLRIKHY